MLIDSHVVSGNVFNGMVKHIRYGNKGINNKRVFSTLTSFGDAIGRHFSFRH